MYNTVVAIAPNMQDHKIAALFFDFVFPLAQGQASLPKEVLYGGKEGITKYRPDLNQLQHALARAERKSGVLMDHYLNENVLEIRKNLLGANIDSAPIFRNTEQYNYYNQSSKHRTIEVELLKTPVIDAENLSWEHIIEIRKDKNFRSRARAFRLFLVENYEGKDKSYIQDSLSNKLYEYEASCKTHGIKSALSTIKTTLNSKSLLASFGLTASAILLGEPLLASGAITTGVAIEFGKIAINIAENKFSMESLTEQSDTSFLFEANSVFE